MSRFPYLRFLSEWRSVFAPGCAFAMLLLSMPVYSAAEPGPSLKGLSHHEIMRLGEDMYRKGVLPSGETMQALVEGDILVEGTMFTCVSCHMRSGMGSVEGTVITPPTNGASLFRARKPGPRYTEAQEKRRPVPFRISEDRPAYTDETLGSVLSDGVDPAGKTLDDVMPRYMLNLRDRAILVYYLKNLSAVESPGISASRIDFATVVASGVSKADREAMLAPLEAYIRSRNVRAPYHQKRAALPTPEEMDLSNRSLALTVWELQGEPETWRKQLERYYRDKPVFALLGGIAGGDWRPIHEFCEQNKIPCILPQTDRPVLSEDAWYTLYVSKGLSVEGEVAARYLLTGRESSGPGRRRIVQVYRERSRGAEAAKGFREAWSAAGQSIPEEIRLRTDEVVPADLVTRLAGSEDGAVVALWLDFDDLSRVTFPEAPAAQSMVLVSGGILKDRLSGLSAGARPYTFITYPYRLPLERREIERVVKAWMKTNKIPETDLFISSNMYALGTILTDAFMHMKRNYYRDYFLDVIDMLSDRTHTVFNHPRWSFGPGQRYVSKGAYVIQLSEGAEPEFIKRSEWVSY